VRYSSLTLTTFSLTFSPCFLVILPIFSAAFLAPLAVVNLSCVAIACWQAYEARSIKSEFAETKYIGLAMFSLFQAFLTGIPVVSVVKDLPQTYYFVLTLMIFLLSVVVLGLIFIPKVLMLHNYAGMTDAEQKKRMESSVALSANPSRGFQRRPTHDGGNGGESGNTAASLRKIPQYSPSTNSAGDMSTGFIKSVSFKANRLSPNHEETSGLPKLYPLSQIKNVTNSLEFAPQLIDAISRGFVDYQYGKFNAAPIQTLGAPPTMAPFVKVEGYQSQTCVKSGYFEGYPYFVVKVASGGYPMTNSGSVQLYSQQSGEMECLLFDRGLLTELRTAAVGALAAKLLAPKVINKIGMLGTGVQARYQLDYLQHVTTCRNVLVWGRSNSSSLDAFVADVRSQGWSVEVAKEPNDLLKDCELVVTTTSSREAILQNCNENEERSAWKVRLITCIGADAPGKMELDPKLVNSAAMLVADSIQQTVERGEFQHWCQMGSASKDKILPLGQVIENQDLHRHEQDDGLVIFDSSGVALQDAVIAQMVYTVLNDDARPSIKEEPAPYLPPSVVVPVENVSNVPARSIHEACIIDSQIDSRSNSQGIQSIPRTTESTEVHE
jgi:ornithine cyclodeaminase